MTDTNETQVEVTQADRDAAAGYEKKYPAEDNPFAFEMERGDADSTPLVQAFARHRIQAEKRNNALAVEAENLRYVETVMAEAQEALCGNGEVCIDASGNDTLHIARGHLSRILAAFEGDE